MRIYVGNLAYETNEGELRGAFEAHGEVQEVSVVRDRETSRSRGFAFVEMPTKTDAEAAISALNGKEVGGRTLTVNEAKARQERGSGGGGGGYSGGGGSGGYGGGGGGGGGGRGSRW